jgi:predicted amidohydrolase YtcJ
MQVNRRELIKTAGAMAAALPLAELPIGGAGKGALARMQAAFQPGDVPDVLVLNARIYTLDSAGQVAEALAIKNGRIMAVGDIGAVRALAGPGTRQLDLAGLTVLPGFYDSHNHMRLAGLNLFAVDLSGARTIADVLAAIAQRAAITPAGEWIVASSRWHESQLAENRFPTREELDAVAPHNPVWIPRGGHNRVVNSAAFALAGIDDSTPDPPGGTYVRNPASGRMTGHTIDRAFVPILRLLPQPTADQARDGLRAIVRAYHEAGITSVMEAAAVSSDLADYQRVWASGDLTVRTTALFRIPPGFTEAELGRALDTMRDIGFTQGFGDEWLRLGGIKSHVDGGVETGYLREPYAYADDPSEPRGKPVCSPENMQAMCLLANELGWQVTVHCVGDAGIDQVLDAYAAAHAVSPLNGKRWTLIHMMRARPEHFDRARELGLCITAQQPLMYALGAGFVQYWGDERAAACEPLKMYLDSGLPVGNGSDAPTAYYEPLLNIWSAGTRETQLAGVRGPEWAIPVADSIRWYTRGSAYCAFEEDRKGALEPGKLADLIALSVDPYQVSAREVRDAQVLLTMVGGRIVHDGRPGAAVLPQREARGFLVPGGCDCAEPPA